MDKKSIVRSSYLCEKEKFTTFCLEHVTELPHVLSSFEIKMLYKPKLLLFLVQLNDDTALWVRACSEAPICPGSYPASYPTLYQLCDLFELGTNQFLHALVS